MTNVTTRGTCALSQGGSLRNTLSQIRLGWEPGAVRERIVGPPAGILRLSKVLAIFQDAPEAGGGGTYDPG